MISLLSCLIFSWSWPFSVVLSLVRLRRVCGEGFLVAEEGMLGKFGLTVLVGGLSVAKLGLKGGYLTLLGVYFAF